MRAYPQPLWTGEKLASGRLLIWGEQGVGDEIMFAGLIPDVIRTGNRCILDCDARLKPLFVRSFPEVDVVSRHDGAGHNPELDIAAHLPSGSLPGLFRATDAAFAATTSPYLIADPVARERFRARSLCRWQTAGRAGVAYKQPEDGPQPLHRSVVVRPAVCAARYPMGQPAIWRSRRLGGSGSGGRCAHPHRSLRRSTFRHRSLRGPDCGDGHGGNHR